LGKKKGLRREVSGKKKITYKDLCEERMQGVTENKQKGKITKARRNLLDGKGQNSQKWLPHMIAGDVHKKNRRTRVLKSLTRKRAWG